MNYLETGLSHTEFYPKKTQFSPPRFMPMTSLSRKYLGLEPLSKRDLDELVRRLSPPKKQTAEPEEPVTIKVREIRPKTTGTGRFVGEKRMNSFQIEKMVERLYSRRSTKDYAFVDETVVADDILNMTGVLSDSSDSEDESKYIKDRRNSYLWRQGSTRMNPGLEADEHHRREHSDTFKRQDSFRQHSKTDNLYSESAHKDSTEIPRLKLDSRPKGSVMFAREVTFAGDKRKISNASSGVAPRRRSSDCYNNGQPGAEFRRASSSHINNQNQVVEVVRMNRGAEIMHNKPISRRPKSEPIMRAQNTDNLHLKLEKLDKSDNKITNTDHEPTTETLGSPRFKQGAQSRVDQTMVQPDTSMDVGNKSTLVDRKAPRYAAAPCDDLLIDRVATYNRSPRSRRT